MTDWSAFSKDAKKLIAHYSDDDLKKLLLTLDPQVLGFLTLTDKARILMGMTSKKEGREKIYLKIFEKILPRIGQAPADALISYNALVDFLFTEKAASFVKPKIIDKPKPKEPVAQELKPHVTENPLDVMKLAFRTRAAPLLQQLFSPELMAYTDLPNEANRILHKMYEGASSDEAKEFYDTSYKELEELINHAKERSEKIEVMKQYAHSFATLTTEIKKYKDLEEEFSGLAKRVKALEISRQDLAKSTYSENEEKLRSLYKDFLELKKDMPEILTRFAKESESCEIRAEDDKSAIKRRLFEVFWNISPYNDLLENFVDMRKKLTDELKKGLARFYLGQLTSKNLLEMCQEMPYEHDVVKLRNEITHRSSRLKDLRDELIRLYYELLETRRFLEICSLDSQAISQLIQEVSGILKDVENPFRAFSKAETKDDINYIFRGFWIRIEEIQPKIEEAEHAARLKLKKSPLQIKSAYLTALDTLEEFLSLLEKTRRPIVRTAQQELAPVANENLFDTLVSQIHGIEKRYPFIKPFSFFMHVKEHKVRLEIMQEAYQLDDYVTKLIQFAKEMQYVKTFEEERVDIILEAFEKQHLIEDSWNLYRERQARAARLVEDEIFLDIGLLDRHALMDVDQKALAKTLRLAASRAKEHIFEPKYGILANLCPLSDAPLCMRAFQGIKLGFEEWAQVVVDETKSIDSLLEHLRSYCHLLFDAKITVAARAKMLLPMCLEFMNELRSYEKIIREELLQKRSAHLKEWGPEWLGESHTIRSLIECFEPPCENGDAFMPLLEKIEELVSVISECKQMDLDSIKKELYGHLQEIDEIAKNPKKEHPFIYIPGYLAFFDASEAPC